MCSPNPYYIPYCPEARCLASSHDCKYVEVSAGLNHNVDTLLVSVVQCSVVWVSVLYCIVLYCGAVYCSVV